MSPGEHVIHTTWRAYNYMRGSSRKLMDFMTDIGPANAGMACCLHVVTQRQNNLLDLKKREENNLFRIK